MPERLFQANRAGLPARVACYRSVADILETVDRERPDAVFLFSAYLYAINNILDIAATGELVQGLRQRTRAIVTSDPFLGVLTRPDESLFHPQHPLRTILASHFTALAPHLKDLKHLYFMPADEIPVSDRIWFANPKAFLTPAVTDAGEAALVARIGIDRTKPRWLYVLSTEDYGYQTALHGQQAFESLLLARFSDAAGRAGSPCSSLPRRASTRWPVRTGAPQSFGLSHSAGTRSSSPYPMGAEFVFYWNVFSNSILRGSRIACRSSSSVAGTWLTRSPRCTRPESAITIRAAHCRFSISGPHTGWRHWPR